MLLRLVPGDTDFKFIKLRSIAIPVSIAMMLGSVALFFVMGLNYGIDFRGGTLIEISTEGPADLAQIRATVSELDLGEVQVQEFGTPNDVLIRIEEQSGGGDTREAELSNQSAVDVTRAALNAEFARITFNQGNLDDGFFVEFTRDAAFELAPLQQWLDDRRVTSEQVTLTLDENNTARAQVFAPYRFGPDEDSVLPADDYAAEIRGAVNEVYTTINYRRTEVVGPKVSGELVQAGSIAVILAVLAVLIYIWFRFEWQFAVGAVIALVHDVVLTIGVFSLFRLEFGLAIVAAILTIVGYSLNDTVVVYDRVREKLRKYKRMALPDLLDFAINKTLSRTVMTSLTTLLALIALYAFGGEVIRGFTFAMIWGVIVGTYSSIFIASPALLILGVKRDWSAEGSENAATQTP